MSEIKYAIEILKKFSLEYTSSLKEVKAIHLAVDILTEKLEREQKQKYCDYCVALHHLTKASHRNAYKYCPMCAKEVTK
jgi:hypothetical protein